MSTADLNRPGPVVCIGETMAMAVATGSVEPGSDCSLDLAGAESNVARSLVRVGTPAAWISAVGDDPFGAMIIRCLSGEGIDTSAVRVDPRRAFGSDPGAGIEEPHPTETPRRSAEPSTPPSGSR